MKTKNRVYDNYKYLNNSVKVNRDIYEATTEDNLILVKVDGLNINVNKCELKSL